MQLNEPHKQFADRVVFRLAIHPGMSAFKPEYQQDMLSELHSFLVERSVSSHEQLQSLELRKTLSSLSKELRRKRTALSLLKMGDPATWRLREEIYNHLEPRFEALKVLNDWLYSSA